MRVSVSLLAVLLMVGCADMGVRTVDRDKGGSGKVVSQDISGGQPVESVNTPEEVAQDSQPMKRVQYKSGNGGVLLAYELRGEPKMIPTRGCRLKLQNVTDSKTFFVELKSNQNVVYKELTPGRYFGTRLSCKTTKIWNLDNLFAGGFDVVDGNVSYVGKVVFEFSPKDLEDFHSASRTESRNAFMDAQTWFTDEPKFISGFTKKPLTSDMAGGDSLDAFDVYAKGTNDPGTVLQSLLANLNKCSARAGKEDPVRFGDLKYVASYKSRKLEKLDKQDNKHALSDSFIDCIENSLRGYQPPVAGTLEVTLRY